MEVAAVCWEERGEIQSFEDHWVGQRKWVELHLADAPALGGGLELVGQVGQMAVSEAQGTAAPVEGVAAVEVGGLSPTSPSAGAAAVPGQAEADVEVDAPVPGDHLEVQNEGDILHPLHDVQTLHDETHHVCYNRLEGCMSENDEEHILFGLS